eukprot:TRINITY_DN66337_c8_g15_i1.p1 TRINITY_DN66337_c8_g15~~TRINITY_DN66337_c8_g15_i1.p1  ORF type:complete len:424 (+),score=-1.93 TRINITY_DN66337_c8_g15_i1:114-1274(+)
MFVVLLAGGLYARTHPLPAWMFTLPVLWFSVGVVGSSCAFFIGSNVVFQPVPDARINIRWLVGCIYTPAVFQAATILSSFVFFNFANNQILATVPGTVLLIVETLVYIALIHSPINWSNRLNRLIDQRNATLRYNQTLFALPVAALIPPAPAGVDITTFYWQPRALGAGPPPAALPTPGGANSPGHYAEVATPPSCQNDCDTARYGATVAILLFAWLQVVPVVFMAVLPVERYGFYLPHHGSLEVGTTLNGSWAPKICQFAKMDTNWDKCVPVDGAPPLKHMFAPSFNSKHTRVFLTALKPYKAGNLHWRCPLYCGSMQINIQNDCLDIVCVCDPANCAPVRSLGHCGDPPRPVAVSNISLLVVLGLVVLSTTTHAVWSVYRYNNG